MALRSSGCVTACAVGLLLSQCTDQDQSSSRIPDEQTISELVRDEEAVLEITPLANRLASSLIQDNGLCEGQESLFADQIPVIDLGKLGEFSPRDHGIEEGAWELADEESISAPDSIWKSLTEFGGKIHAASFGFLSGAQDARGNLVTRMKFNANGSSETCHYAHSGKVIVHWRKVGGDWRIARWETLKMHTARRSALMFSNQTRQLFSPEDYQVATRSAQEEAIIQFALDADNASLPKKVYYMFFDLHSDFMHPGISVVDINQDGWDDLFVTSMWRRCQLWVNQQGKGFKNMAAAYGLDVHAASTSAIFADFDNDGDNDLVLGRSLERSLMFWNNGGRFAPDPVELPFFVTSVSAADANGDGLLDFFLCCYGSRAAAYRHLPQWPEMLLEPDDAAALRKKEETGHPYFDAPGPRNHLFINRGDRKFVRLPVSSVPDTSRSTFQASWADYDLDGDQDIYVSNDFGPDELLRNNGNDRDGMPTFTDVSR
ncbi:MAG: VCBS repeat-containing protein, partial [Akkermansiaceae bacterium]|nr:VCBS repeat-containing protein [Akkermansiaceae bacterium]